MFTFGSLSPRLPCNSGQLTYLGILNSEIVGLFSAAPWCLQLLHTRYSPSGKDVTVNW